MSLQDTFVDNLKRFRKERHLTQEKFAEFVQAVDAQKAKAQKSLDKAETLYKALMQEYLG